MSFDGRYYRAEDLSLALRPVRKPRPPLWLGASAIRSVERAADVGRHGDWGHLGASSHLTDSTIVEQSEAFASRLEALGNRSLPTSRCCATSLSRGPRDRGAREAVPYLQASYRVFDRWGLFTDVIGDPGAARGIPELLAGRVIIGSAEDCAEELVRLGRRIGFTRLIARVQWMGMENRIVCRTIELLAGRSGRWCNGSWAGRTATPATSPSQRGLCERLVEPVHDHGVGRCEIAQLAVGIGTLGGGEHPTGHRAPQLWPNTSN